MNVNDSYTLKKMFSSDDVIRFAELSQDFNPIHLNEDFAKTSMFGKRIVHGILVSSLFSGIISEHIPGPGSIYLSQTLSFKAPVYLDEIVEVTVKILAIRNDKPIYTLETICKKEDGTTAITGEAIILKKK